jgi:hypothetical protein
MTLKNARGKDLHLYRVDYQMSVYCLAVDEFTAETAGYLGAREQVSLEDCLIYEVKTGDSIDPITLTTLPWGAQSTEGDLTIQQILTLLGTKEKETNK